ncbi:hypothetical protein M406DRAFT_353953 [Cryphonectria parasitica EP155]|uniref:Nephrocystin 3-like N-terminal domain-containing protein n=1 Tax=Cryphonectria parasitica (strain ATCC 38755 / EP155) TaxID=660469 RepID=A0A9P5CHH2_CRYP1|nr:uncharacterized protein M406DRAFT_353953 [Cryphonectria parasitica EP155]KAF3759978.1 hypothetical protein M406DRAFT_353953 [Cryphonectria parasitica EP155]
MELVSRKIALDGQLKPEVRLGQAISEFLYALDEGKRNEFRNIQATSSRRLSGTDVMMLTEEINKAGLRQNRCFKPHGTRIYSFLSRLQTFASVGDVLIGGSQNLIATGVWSALRFCLLGAVNFLGYFEKISTLLMRLGTSCLASQLLSTLGTSFDEEFGPLQKELDQWGFLIQKGAEQTAMEVNIDLGVQLREHNITLKRLFSGEAKRRSHAFKCQVLQDLSPGQSQYEMCWRRQRGKGSCKWIFETQGYQDWNSMETSTVFMVEGKLGSGKTVAMANLVTDMNTASKGPCAYFFCTFKEPESLNAINVLRSIAFHFLDGMRIEDISWDKVFDEKGVPLPRLSSPDAIVDILLDLLPKKPKYSVVLDGVDDCPDDEIYDIFKALHRLMQNRVVLVCYSARTDSRFRHIAGRELGSSFSATLDDEAHDEEMRAFIDQEILRRNKSQDLDADLLSIVINQLVTGSQGMYLWVSLQLDAIFPSNSKTVVTNERIFNLVMNLPRDLPEAFERALGGIIDKSYEEKIFKLVMAAESPLTIDEMRIALAITPGNVLWDPHKIPRDGEQLIALCGGDILELDEEDSRAHNFTGSVCVTYLNIPDLGSQIAMTQPLDAKEVPQRSMMSVQREEPTLSRIVQLIKSSKRAPESLGVHAFKKYALVNWFIHTRFFRSDDESLGACWDLWWHLLSGHVAQVKPHFSDQVQDSQSALIWAKVRRSLQENWVPQAMIDLISRRQSEAIALSILKYRPNIRTEAPMNSVLGAAVLFEYIETSRTLVVDWNLDPTKHFYGSRSAVQISVENRNQELRKILYLSNWVDSDEFLRMLQFTLKRNTTRASLEILNHVAHIEAEYVRSLLNIAEVNGAPPDFLVSTKPRGWQAEVGCIIDVLMRDSTSEYFNMQDDKGNTALHYLSRLSIGHMTSQVKLLIARCYEELPKFDVKDAYSKVPGPGSPADLRISNLTLIHGPEIAGGHITPEFFFEMKPVDLDTIHFDIQDEEGNTVLHYLAVSKCSQVLVKDVLKPRVNPNIRNRKGETPLFVAGWNLAPPTSVINPLLEAGADPNAEAWAHPGRTILGIALQRAGSPAKIIRRHGF